VKAQPSAAKGPEKKTPKAPVKAAMPKVTPERPEAEQVAELTAADLVGPTETGPTEYVAAATETISETVSEAVEPVEENIIEKSPETPVVEHNVEAETQAMQKGTEIMSDVMETTKKYTEEAKERFQSAFAEMSEKAKVGVEKSSKTFEELSDIAKGNVEAFVESGKIASKGVESMGHGAAEYGRMTFEKASAAMKSMAAVKSPAEFFQLQSELLSSSFDAFAKEAAKNSEAMLKLAGDVAQPISTRVSVVTEKVRSLAA
tara:strand:- start:24069 stop:24848 length:780 start_codon:yes stop_codon:yes gene_type:complete